ncbi:MAG: hypothetical protein IJA89_05825 [Clostridia bacterium]|nr:hypothetical protein [Clostridiales bacterium]MBQ3506270.1 hypothetical protein [Clostridia bacterium]
MAQQKKGLITRLLEGKEKSEEYARSTLPTNRWALFWDIFKGNFGKIVKVNLLTILFFIPIIAIIVIYNMLVDAQGVTYPFSANLGIGYPAVPAQQGLAEMITLQNNFILFIGLALSSVIAAVGLSGGMYVIRNMVWTEGIFVSNDFWRGIKLNYKNALQAALFFCTFLLLSGSLISFADFSLAVGEMSKWQKIFLTVSKVMSYLLVFLAGFMTFWMISLGVNYKMKFFTLVRNSFLMTIGTLPQTIFFIAMALLPFALLLIPSTFFLVLAIFVVLLFALSWALLVWIDFSQWVFDKYINPKIQGAKVGRGIYNKDGSSALTGDDSAAAVEYQRTILSYGRSRLVARPIKPIDDSLQVYELPTSFSREDLKRLRESKQNIIEDTEAYAEEHKNDLRYVEYNKTFDEREKALQDEVDKNGKKKKRKPPKLLGE